MNHALLLLPCLCVPLLAQSPVRVPTPPAQPVAAGITTAPLAEAPKVAPPARAAAVAAPRAPARGHQVAAAAAPQLPQLPQLPGHVVFDRPAGGAELWAIGDLWKARFDGRGFDFVPFFGASAPRNFPLRVELLRASVGGQELALREGRPEVSEQQVRTARGDLVEVVDTAMAHVEHSYVFETLPRRGAVAVDVRLEGDYEAIAIPAGVRFRNAHGAIDYLKAVARDAAGATLELPIEWRGAAARIEIPASFVAAARLPLVLDPIVATNPSLAPGFASARAQRNVDLAKVGSTTSVVWTRTWSASDEDVVVQQLDDALNFAGMALYLDFTSQNWLQPRIAPNNRSQKFLCVAQVGLGTATWIGGRLIDTAGVIGPVLDIERSGTAGHLAGNNFRPDVGGDPYTVNTAAFYTVVFEHEAAPGNNDVYYKQINQDGTLRHITPIPLDTGSNNQSNPSIAASNGVPTLSNRTLVAWQSQSPSAPFDENIWGAYVEWNGNLLVPAFQLSNSTLNERHPTVSSVATANGANVQMVAYEIDYVSDNDILLKVVDDLGASLTTYNFSGAMAGGAVLLRNQTRPSVDTDGTRFVVGYSEYSGTDYDSFVSTIAFLPTTAACRIDEDRVVIGGTVGSDDFGPTVFAEFSANSQQSIDYLLGAVNVGTNDIEVRTYGGHVPGGFATFQSQCGNLPITGSGVPALGNEITFSLSTTSFFSGFVFGFPGYAPLSVCSCILGVNSVANVPGPTHSWRVPTDPTMVNAFTLSIQGFAFGGTACLGAIDLSNTLDFQIR